MKRTLRAALGALPLLALAFAGPACVTRPMPPWDIAAPGWQRHGFAAVWRPDSQSPEIAGELLLAEHPDGSRWVQFSKQGLPVVVARSGAAGWEIGSPLRKRTFRGTGRPPGRIVWFRIRRDGPGSGTDGGWTATTGPDGRGGWILERARTGERLEVVP